MRRKVFQAFSLLAAPWSNGVSTEPAFTVLFAYKRLFISIYDLVDKLTAALTIKAFIVGGIQLYHLF